MFLNVSPLKKFAIENPQIPEPLRQLIIEEPDYMDANEYAIKVETWLKLLKLTKKP